MKVDVQDGLILGELSIEAVQTYLRGRGFHPADEPKLGFLWYNSDGDELVVPRHEDTTDYPIRIHDIVSYFAEKTGRSQLEIVKELQSVSFDVLQLPSLRGADSEYNVPLEVGARAIAGLQGLLLASAYATLEKRSAIPSRRPPEVSQYVSSIRLAPILNGRIAYAVLSPIGFVERQPSLFQESSSSGKPYQRRVVETLTDAVSAAALANSRASEVGISVAFDEAVHQGVSATLCDALADLIESDSERCVDLRITWSPKIKTEKPSVIRRDRQDADVYRDASRRLREIAEREVLIVGQVVGLRKQFGEPTGRVTIATSIDNEPRFVTVSLADSDYAIAHRAHPAGRFVSISGVLRREGTHYVLKSPNGFRMASELGSPEDEQDSR